MKRARPLPPDERRRALIDATIPLLLEHGPTVPTRRIAEAAGVAEGTIFRVFESKDDLLHACLIDALSTDDLVADLRGVENLDLHATLVATTSALIRRGDTIRTLFGMLHQGSGPLVAHPHTDSTCQRPDPALIRDDVLAVITEALAPHAGALTQPVRTVALTLMTLGYGAAHMGSAPDSLDPEALADILLEGITR